jgi:hypothetical protein
LHHAATSEPGRPGYILKGEAFSSPFQRAMTEIAENLDREDPDWRDTVHMIVKAWTLAKREKHAAGETILQRDFGYMIGVEYMKIQGALAIHEDLVAHPERYKDVTSIRGAHSKLLAINQAELNVILAKKSLEELPQIGGARPPSISVSAQNDPELTETPPIVIPLTSAFIHANSLTYMAGLAGPTFDHILTDPDYGVSIERLGASVNSAHLGVEQETVADSLSDMYKFLELAWHVVKDQGFCVFWYDLDHHEKLRDYASKIGWSVQRWPLTWIKSDYRSNAAPAHNFTKNVEWAMVLRKPNAVLTQVQQSAPSTVPPATPSNVSATHLLSPPT